MNDLGIASTLDSFMAVCEEVGYPSTLLISSANASYTFERYFKRILTMCCNDCRIKECWCSWKEWFADPRIFFLLKH